MEKDNHRDPLMFLLIDMIQEIEHKNILRGSTLHNELYKTFVSAQNHSLLKLEHHLLYLCFELWNTIQNYSTKHTSDSKRVLEYAQNHSNQLIHLSENLNSYVNKNITKYKNELN